MSSYIEASLLQDERVLYTGHISWWSLSGYLVAGVLLLPIGIGLILLVMAYVKYKSTELAFTNKRVITKFGFISRHTVEINLAKVESIRVEQGLLGRLFDYGTLIVAGAGEPQAPIPGISDPMGFRKAFMQAQQPGTASA